MLTNTEPTQRDSTQKATVATPRPATKKTCSVCGSVLTFHQAIVGSLCDDWSCIRTTTMQDQTREIEEKAAVTAAAVEIRAQVAQKRNIDNPESLLLAILPANRSSMKAVPEQRREAFASRAAKLIGEAFEQPIPQPPDTENHVESETALSTADQTLLLHACAACQGFCCQGGSNHAYLNAGTFNNFRARNSKVTASAVFDAYMEHIPAQIYDHSCIFHTAAGCNLPRDMRSKTCNDYLCKGLNEFKTKLIDHRGANALAVATRQTAVVRWTVLDRNAEPDELP